VYVALSRCTSLDGLVLHSRIQPHSFFADDRVVKFTRNTLSVDGLKEELAQAKKEYQEKVLLGLFDFTRSVDSIKELQAYLLQHRSSFNTDVFVWADELLTKLENLRSTAEKFHVQIKTLFAQQAAPEENVELQERLKKGAGWFSQEIRAVTEMMQQSPAVTDSTMHAKEYNELLREVYVQLSQQLYLMNGFGGRFEMDTYHRRKRLFVTPAFGVNAYAGAKEQRVELAHPALFYQLKKKRDDICAKRNLPIYYVASSKTLEEMATYLPLTLDELKMVNGFGEAKAESYGGPFLEIIQQYAAEKNLVSSISEKSPKRKRKEKGEVAEKKPDTKSESLRMYKEGMSISQIAKERNLTNQTIEGHLAHFVHTGDIAVTELVTADKVARIEPALKSFEKGGSLTSIKEKLPPDITYGEIRLVLAHCDRQSETAR
jgi:ribonuclease D